MARYYARSALGDPETIGQRREPECSQRVRRPRQNTHRRTISSICAPPGPTRIFRRVWPSSYIALRARPTTNGQPPDTAVTYLRTALIAEPDKAGTLRYEPQVHSIAQQTR